MGCTSSSPEPVMQGVHQLQGNNGDMDRTEYIAKLKAKKMGQQEVVLEKGAIDDYPNPNSIQKHRQNRIANEHISAATTAHRNGNDNSNVDRASSETVNMAVHSQQTPQPTLQKAASSTRSLSASSHDSPTRVGASTTSNSPFVEVDENCNGEEEIDYADDSSEVSGQEPDVEQHTYVTKKGDKLKLKLPKSPTKEEIEHEKHRVLKLKKKSSKKKMTEKGRKVGRAGVSTVKSDNALKNAQFNHQNMRLKRMQHLTRALKVSRG